MADIKIADFRKLVDRLNSSRHWLTGGTPEEFRKQPVKIQLQHGINKVEAMLPLVPERFKVDLLHAQTSIKHANSVILRWELAQKVKELANEPN